MHGNADKLGNKAANQYIAKDRYAIITGTLKTPAKNSETLTGSVEINYPAGFTKDNCAIFSIMSHGTTHTNYWTLSTAYKSSMEYILGSNCSATLKTDKILVKSNKVDAAAGSDTITYKIVLMRID